MYIRPGLAIQMEIKKETLSMVNNDSIPMEYHSIGIQSMNYRWLKTNPRKKCTIIFFNYKLGCT